MIPYKIIQTISVGPLEIKIWGVMVALGMLAGLLITSKEAKRKKISTDLIYNFFLWIFIAAILGARIFYVFLFFPYFAQNPLEIFAVWNGGLVFYGGFIGALIPLWVIVKKHKIPFWKIADTIIPGLALGLFIGRIGCYLTGLHIGIETNFFLGVDYLGESRIQTAMLSSINGLIMFLVLWSIRKYKMKEGTLSLIFLGWYSIFRFFLEFLRAYDLPGSDPRFYGLTISQYICISILLLLTIRWFLRFYKKS